MFGKIIIFKLYVRYNYQIMIGVILTNASIQVQWLVCNGCHKDFVVCCYKANNKSILCWAFIRDKLAYVQVLTNCQCLTAKWARFLVWCHQSKWAHNNFIDYSSIYFCVLIITLFVSSLWLMTSSTKACHFGGHTFFPVHNFAIEI